jgi:hypothetical protein
MPAPVESFSAVLLIGAGPRSWDGQLSSVLLGPPNAMKFRRPRWPGPPFKESVRCAEQNLYARAKELMGAVLMLVSLISAWNLPAAIVEGFWALISIYGLLKHGGWLGLR